MTKRFFRLWQFLPFYFTAVTKYQLHSPFVFELANAVLEDERWYYAFRDVEVIRAKMRSSQAILQVRDFGTGNDRQIPLNHVLRRAASSAGQGKQLFRLANWANPDTMLELGTSLGIGAMYLMSGARTARFVSLEGCPQTAEIARTNIDLMGFGSQVEVMVGPFEKTLQPALEKLQTVDFVYLDGHHLQAPTLAYFEKCLQFSTERTVFVFDDMHWSAEMVAAWAQIQQHQQVTLTVDFFDLSLVFINPNFKQKQHLKIVPSRWKFWKFF